MFWYICGILAGFAIGRVIAITQKRNRKHTKMEKPTTKSARGENGGEAKRTP